MFRRSRVYSADTIKTAADVATSPTNAPDAVAEVVKKNADKVKETKPRNPGIEYKDKLPFYFAYPESVFSSVKFSGTQAPTEADYKSSEAIKLDEKAATDAGLNWLPLFASKILGSSSGAFYIGSIGHIPYSDFVQGCKGKDYKTSTGYTLPFNFKQDWFDFWFQDSDDSCYSLLDDKPLNLGPLQGGRFQEAGILARVGTDFNWDSAKPTETTEVENLDSHFIFSAEEVEVDNSPMQDDSVWVSPYTQVSVPKPSGNTLRDLVSKSAPKILLWSYKVIGKELRSKYKVRKETSDERNARLATEQEKKDNTPKVQAQIFEPQPDGNSQQQTTGQETTKS